MTPHTLGLIIGGFLPALCFSVANLSAKAASEAGISVGWYVLFVGASIACVGGLFLLATSDRSFSGAGTVFSALMGVSWGVGIGSLIIAMNKYGTPIGVLTPLFNMNTLITVLVALWIFSEWKTVHVPQLLIGSALIVIGGTLVAKA